MGRLARVGLLGGALALAACENASGQLNESLAVVNWYPSGSAPCVSPDTGVWITFSAPVIAENLATQVHLLVGSSPITVDRDYDPDSATLVLQPAEPLPWGTVHTVRVDRGVEAESGVSLPARAEIKFRTIPSAGCVGSPECLVDEACGSSGVCSVTSVCVEECAVDPDCPPAQTCQSGSCG